MLILLEKFTLCAFLTGITAVGTWKDLNALIFGSWQLSFLTQLFGVMQIQQLEST